MRKVGKLSEDEAGKVREVIRLCGLDDAAKKFGSIDVRTLAKAACGGPVQTLTLSVIRGRLEVL